MFGSRRRVTLPVTESSHYLGRIGTTHFNGASGLARSLSAAAYTKDGLASHQSALTSPLGTRCGRNGPRVSLPVWYAAPSDLMTSPKGAQQIQRHPTCLSGRCSSIAIQDYLPYELLGPGKSETICTTLTIARASSPKTESGGESEEDMLQVKPCLRHYIQIVASRDG